MDPYESLPKEPRTRRQDPAPGGACGRPTRHTGKLEQADLLVSGLYLRLCLRIIPVEKPDVILMDVFLPRMSGIECTSRLKAQLPHIPIVMLTASDEDEILFLALESGADGYLLKRTKPAELRAALLDVLSGGAPMSSEIARHVVASFRRKSGGVDPSIALTAREEETLVLLTKGYANKEIADHLSLSIETVRSHLKNIYTKMHVRSRVEAVAHYMSKRP
jgi:DNA-binding NarL/FixJ family response regulator